MFFTMTDELLEADFQLERRDQQERLAGKLANMQISLYSAATNQELPTWLTR
jgi:hypothetical protein